MNFLVKFLKSEIAYFKKLNFQGHRLIISFSVSGLTDPIVFTFVNAFLYRNTESIELVAFFNLFLFLGLPPAFYLNGLLLRKYSAGRLYFFGCLAQGGLIFLLLTFASPSYQSVSLFGFLYGIALGFYWANRNFLTLRITDASNRIYFNSLESLAGTAIRIMVPILVGWFLVLGEHFGLYSISTAYQLLAVVTLVILISGGFLLKDLHFESVPSLRVLLPKPSPQWQKFRLFMFLTGFGGSAWFFIPVVIVLTLVGNEGALGTIESAAAVLSAFMVYYVSRKAETKDRLTLFIIWSTLILLGGFIFGIMFSVLGTILLFAFNALADPFGYVSTTSFAFDTIDREKEHHPSDHYAFVFDQELFLNIGRVTGSGVFFVMLWNLPQDMVLRLTPFVFALAQVGEYFIIKSLDKQEIK